MTPGVVDRVRRLESLRRRRQRLAWATSVASIITTSVYFALMTSGSAVLTRVVWGTATTVATVAAMAIIAALVLAVAAFARLAARIDELSGGPGR